MTFLLLNSVSPVEASVAMTCSKSMFTCVFIDIINKCNIICELKLIVNYFLSLAREGQTKRTTNGD